MRITRTRLLCEMQANSFWAEFPRIIFKFRKKQKISRRLFTSFIKREFRHFPLIVAVTVKKWTNKRDAHAELLFCLFNQLIFWRSRCRRRRGILKSLVSCSALFNAFLDLISSHVSRESGKTKRAIYVSATELNAMVKRKR